MRQRRKEKKEREEERGKRVESVDEGTGSLKNRVSIRPSPSRTSYLNALMMERKQRIIERALINIHDPSKKISRHRMISSS